MIDLNDLNVYTEYDLQKMINHLNNFPELCREAWRKAMLLELPQDYSDIDRVMVLGMGGSAIGGDLISRLIVNEAKIPITVNRSYNLPAYVDKRTLIIACSYSGYTEETLSALAQALDVDAKCMVISTGGKLKEIAEEKHLPLFTFDYDAQPRATLPFSFMAVYCTLQRLGIICDKSADIAETIKILEQLSQQLDITIPLEKNQAKQMAEKLYGKFIFIYGSEITSEIAYRWKTQFNENSKNWAANESFSELNHNTIVGYQYPADFAQNALIILLRSSLISKPILARYQATCRILEQGKIKHSIVDVGGENALAQMLSLVLLGDYISYYLAILNEVDPTPIETIDKLKHELRKDQA
ncbi:MAG: bifunctional phosphoglucose/phosphomannose isomerase [Dehalococcoidales bacterium]|nr:bifunctional phosphoglucose/phosphomannose isomerase [Dehalococcoidales bacterium]